MKTLACAITMAALALALSGCGGNGGSGLPQATIHTNLYNNGVYSNWPNSYVYAQAVQFNCPVGSANCNTYASGQADSSGNYRINSNAIPGYWTVAAQADNYCPTGAGTSTQQLQTNITTQINCGNINQSTAYISPTSCEKDVYLDGTVTNTCPTTITAKVGGNESFPTNRAMNVSTYTEAAQNINSQSITASSSTTMILPTPLRKGDNVVLIKDPNTNQILVAGLFTYTYYQQKCNSGGHFQC